MELCKPFPPVGTVGEPTEMYDHSFGSRHRHDIGNSKRFAVRLMKAAKLRYFMLPLLNMNTHKPGLLHFVEVYITHLTSKRDNSCLATRLPYANASDQLTQFKYSTGQNKVSGQCRKQIR
jgi:hypothetical protein